MLAKTNREEALKIKKHTKYIHNDCSTKFNNIPTSLIKPVNEFIATPFIYIINTWISKKKHCKKKHFGVPKASIFGPVDVKQIWKVAFQPIPAYNM